MSADEMEVGEPRDLIVCWEASAYDSEFPESLQLWVKGSAPS